MDKTALPDSLQLTITNGTDEDLVTLISSLIDQNAELMQKVQESCSQKELTSIVVTEGHKQEEAIRLLVEMVARDKAYAIITEAEIKAKIEADNILAEAKRKAEKIVEEKIQLGIQQGLLIINKAQEQALSILDGVQKQAEAITSKANQKVKRQ
jgi:cell division septum initiation protein DivIVA